jgi:hypothetical protein
MSFCLNVIVETNDAESISHTVINIGFLGCFSKFLWEKQSVLCMTGDAQWRIG